MTDVHPLRTAVEYKFGIFLVDCIVGEMDVSLFKVVLVWSNIRFSCKSSQTFLIDIEPEGTDSTNKNIDSEIKLKSIN